MGGLVQRILMFAWKGRTYGEALQGEYIVHVVRTSYIYRPPKPSDHHVFEPLRETCVPFPFLLVDVMLARLRDCSTCSCDPHSYAFHWVPVARPYLHTCN